MTERLALGLSLETDTGEGDDLTQPLEIALVVKGIDKNGNVGYWIMSTETISSIEALGMFDWAAHHCREG